MVYCEYMSQDVISYKLHVRIERMAKLILQVHNSMTNSPINLPEERILLIPVKVYCAVNQKTMIDFIPFHITLCP